MLSNTGIIMRNDYLEIDWLQIMHESKHRSLWWKWMKSFNKLYIDNFD